MTVIGWIQILLYCAIVVALVKPLGWYMTRVFNGEATFLSPVLRPVERQPERVRGEVDYDDPITAYLPDEARPRQATGAPITLVQLATHTPERIDIGRVDSPALTGRDDPARAGLGVGGPLLVIGQRP